MNLAKAKYEANKFRFRRCIPILGGFLIHLTLGTMQSFGNLVLYTTSYMKVVGNSSFRYKDVSWVYCCAIVTQGIFGFVGGKLERKLGPKLAVLFGGWLMSFGIMISYFTVFNFWLFLLTYGIIAGIGCGLCYSIPLACAVKWVPQCKTIVSGFIFVGRGLSVFICTPLQTYFVNPYDLPPTYAPYPQFSEEKYYDDGVLISRIPLLFLYMGILLAVVQLIGALVMSNPTREELENYYNVYTRLINEENNCYKTLKESYSSYGSNSEDFTSENNENTSESSDINIRLHDCTNRDLEKILTPAEILTNTYFWYLWVMMLFTWLSVAFIQTYWKLIGINAGATQSDLLLSVIGSCASLANTLGRIVWGFVGNASGFKFSMISMCALITILISTLNFSTSYGCLSFTICLCIIFMTHGGSFAVFPAITADAFGKQNFGPVFGLLFSARAASSIICSILASVLSDYIGYFGLALLVSSCTGICFFLSIFHRFVCSSSSE